MRKLHRLAGQKKLAGICAGLGEYFELDPVFFRLFFLVSLFFGGIGALVYLLLWIMVPEKPGRRAAAARRRVSTSRVPTARSPASAAGSASGSTSIRSFSASRFVLFALLCGLGIVVYIALWLFLPRASATPTWRTS